MNKPFTTIKNMAEKGKIAVKKWVFLGQKACNWAQKIMSWQPK